jgi:hypothetical protein
LAFLRHVHRVSCGDLPIGEAYLELRVGDVDEGQLDAFVRERVDEPGLLVLLFDWGRGGCHFTDGNGVAVSALERDQEG